MIDYPWQQPLWQGFQQAVLAQRLPHAILLHGAKGTGKTSFATQMAKVLLCESRQAATACGQCRSCHLWQVGHHADFYRLQPAEEGKTIKIDALRESLEWLQLSPQQGLTKVLLLTPAEGLNTSASNALLKNLEEPAPNTVLILVAEQLASILATLRSRCQLWHMPLPTPLQNQRWLAEQGVVVDESVAKQGPLLLIHRAQAGTLDQQSQFNQQIRAFLEGQLSLLKLSQAIQKIASEEALVWLMQYWQQAATDACLQQQPARTEQYLRGLAAISQLKFLHDAGANLNWPLQWDALLCQLKPLD